MHSFRSNST